MQEKICNKCGVSKTLDNFHLSKTCKYGVRNTCKKCRVVEKDEYLNRPEVKKRNQEYYQEHKEEFRKRMNKHYHSLNGQYHQYKKRAKKSNLIFEFTEEECKIFYETYCFYCGDTIKGIGIDRLDNSKGYTKSNCVPCCSTCNFMKHTQNIENFKIQIMKIVRHLKL